jgi:hypothetical protein
MTSKKGEGHPEQVSVRTLPHGVSTLEISDTLQAAIIICATVN